VLSLEQGFVEVTSTRERLSKLGECGVIDEAMEHDLLEAFGFLQDLRLKRQARALLDQSEAWNVVKAKELTRTDLLILKESLKVVASFQRFLMGRFGVKRPSF
jgi:CBS domain-containing protein